LPGDLFIDEDDSKDYNINILASFR